MAEFVNSVNQTVAVGETVRFDTTTVEPCSVVTHRKGSGIFNIKGGHKFIVAFSANLSGATADTEVDLAIAINGEPVPYTTMAITPAVAGLFDAVSVVTEIATPCNCCTQISVENIGTTPVTVASANIVFVKEA